MYEYFTVDSAYPRTSAAPAGLRPKDVIVSINGFDVSTQRDSAKFRPGLPAKVRVRRGENILELKIMATVVEKP